ncbi:MAG: hypothetical protein HYS32_03265 [Candidatus Woesearchaeota archaeon]|nr:MAG: hypothetical protein HYS32_03265 [Candidatus Woesearchaeota archaeon]
MQDKNYRKQLEAYVKEGLHRGYSLYEIRQRLHENEQSVVEEAISKVLGDLVKEKVKQGYTVKQLKQSFRDNHYPPELITKALSSYRETKQARDIKIQYFVLFLALALTFSLFLTNIGPGITGLVIAGPGQTTELKVQVCTAAIAESSNNSFPDACDGTYPTAGTDNLGADDTNIETHSRGKSQYGGVNVTIFNSSITNCASILSVELCHKRWATSGDTEGACDVSIDNDETNTWSQVNATCTGTSEPSGVTCQNVTNLEGSWTCGNFFGASGPRAQAKVTGSRTSTGGGTVYNTDVLYYKVIYTETVADTAAPSFSSPVNDTNISQYQNNTFNITLTDETQLKNYTLSWNGTGTGSFVNETTFQIGGSSTTWNANTSENSSRRGGEVIGWLYYACDSSNNCNTSATQNYTVPADHYWNNTSLSLGSKTYNTGNMSSITYANFSWNNAQSATLTCSQGNCSVIKANVTTFTVGAYYQYPVNFTCDSNLGLGYAETNYTLTTNFSSKQRQITASCTITSANSPPNAPNLTDPSNNTATTLRFINFTWNNSQDPNGDSLTYNIVVDDDINFGSTAINVSAIVQEADGNTSYNSTTELDVDKQYYWKVRANDSQAYGSFSEIFTFNITSVTTITLTTDLVAFGNLTIDENNNTEDNSPLPFTIRNDGNVRLNITIYATDLFTSSTNPTSKYQFKINESTEGVCWASGTQTSWTNFPNNITSSIAIAYFNYTDINDTAQIEVNITVPSSEQTGDKNSIITYIASVA